VTNYNYPKNQENNKHQMENVDTQKFYESKEQGPKPFGTIYFVRHGESEYKENLVDPDIEDDMTDKGKEQIRNTAEMIKAELEEGEKVFMMSSLRARAETSAKIMGETIGEEGHEIEWLEGGKNSVGNFKLLDKDGGDIHKKKDNLDEYLSDMQKIWDRFEKEPDYYLKYRAKTVEKSHTEDIDKYKKKIEVFLRRIAEIARKREGSNEKMIVATHGEWLDSVLELYLDHTIETYDDSSSNGECIKMEIFQDEIKFYFRDKEVVVDV
jgi:broad specificity phosphatase PhoE